MNWAQISGTVRENGHLYGKGRSSISVWHERGAFGNCLRFTEPSFAHTSNASPHHPLQVLSEPNSNEDVEEGVEASVCICQTFGNLSSYIKINYSVTICVSHISCLSGFHNQQAIVRQLREDKNKHHSKDDTEGLVLFKALGLHKCANDDRITKEHD